MGKRSSGCQEEVGHKRCCWKSWSWDCQEGGLFSPCRADNTSTLEGYRFHGWLVYSVWIDICKNVYIGTEKQSWEPGDNDVGVGLSKLTVGSTLPLMHCVLGRGDSHIKYNLETCFDRETIISMCVYREVAKSDEITCTSEKLPVHLDHV